MPTFCYRFLSLGLAMFAGTAQAVTLEIVDNVIDPGETQECFTVLINPEDQELDGFQFGVQVSGGATVSSIYSTADWKNWVTLGDRSNVSELYTEEGSGYTLVVDVDQADVVTFGGNSPFPAARLCITLPTPASVGETFTVSPSALRLA